MNIGDLNERVTIKSRTAGEDSAGQPLNTWTVTVATLWANRRQVSGMEAIKGGAEMSVTRVSWAIRYRTDLNTDMRLVHGSTEHNIKGITHEGKDWTFLACEVVA
jgi:SPP1 family predicted phage head-tail adaptor